LLWNKVAKTHDIIEGVETLRLACMHLVNAGPALAVFV
jgi:hypothetical protein